MPDEPTAADSACRPVDLFRLLWTTLCDVIGSAATATLIRRSSERAAPRHPNLARVRIERVAFDYRYLLPSDWDDDASAPSLAALRGLLCELHPLLVEMTGPVVVRRLAAIPELRDRRLVASSPEAE